MNNNDVFVGLVVGAMAAAIGAVLAYKYIGLQPPGGGEPRQITSYSPTNWITPQTPPRADVDAAPVVQNTPITEAAYNQYPFDHQPAFGRSANVAAEQDQVVIPW
jgi:hypothetical protein